MASVFILEMRMLRQKEHGSKQEPRLGLCVAHSITMSECEGLTNTWKGGGNCERLHLPELPRGWDHACAPPSREKPRLNHGDSPSLLTNHVQSTIISITPAVPSARLLTAEAVH